MVIILVAVRQSVGVRIMEKAVVPVAPREPLGTQPQVVILDERWPLMALIHVRQIAINSAQPNRWQCKEQRNVLPNLEAP